METGKCALPAVLSVLLLLLVALAFIAACSRSPSGAPTGFSPASKVVRIDDRIARCNTIHSLSLPAAVLGRYGIAADADTAVISCSLQRIENGVPVNMPALLSGTVTLLTGKTVPIDFQETRDHDAISYVAVFDLTARSRIDFDVHLTDVLTGARHHLELRQAALPGRL